MKSVLIIILLVVLSVCVGGDLLAAYRHYFGPREYHDQRNIPSDQRNIPSDQRNIPSDQYQQDNRDRQALWTPGPPEASWNSRQEDRAIDPGFKRSGGGGGGKGCAPTTMWVEKTMDRHVPNVMSNKESRDYKVMHYITQTIINTKSIPYFVTQTEVEPEITKRTEVLPQRITHTVRTTQVRSITKTEKIFNTVTAQRIQKFFKTVCPKGH